MLQIVSFLVSIFNKSLLHLCSVYSKTFLWQSFSSKQRNTQFLCWCCLGSCYVLVLIEKASEPCESFRSLIIVVVAGFQMEKPPLVPPGKGSLYRPPLPQVLFWASPLNSERHKAHQQSLSVLPAYFLMHILRQFSPCGRKRCFQPEMRTQDFISPVLRGSLTV